MMACRADQKVFEVHSKYVDTQRSARVLFARDNCKWGNKSCNCGHDNCKLFCAIVNHFDQDYLTGRKVFRRVSSGARQVVGNPKEARLAFLHYLQWDAHTHRPVEGTEIQPWALLEDLISQTLSLRKGKLPVFLTPFCRHRGNITASSLQQQVLDMGTTIQALDKEVGGG